MIYKICPICAVLLAALPAFGAQDLPTELQHLETFRHQEPVLVGTMRNVQRMQNRLIEWDRDLIREYMREDQRALAEAKTEDIQHRLYLIEAGWEYVLSHYPNNPAANNYLGEFLYDHTSKQTDAVQRWMQAKAMDDEYAPVFNNLGVHYLHNGSIRLGLDHMHKAVELDPDNPDYLFNLAQAYLLYRTYVERWYDKKPKRIYQSAVDYSRRATELDPNDYDLAEDYAVNFYAAENFGVEADWKAAAKAWDRVIALASAPLQQYFAHLNKARVLIRMKDWAGAAHHLEQSIELDPEQEVPRNLLAEVEQHLQSGKN